MTLTALALAALVWVIVAVLVGLLLARTIQLRDGQVPTSVDTERVDDVLLGDVDERVMGSRGSARR